MSFKTFFTLGFVMLMGCASKERFVRVADESLPKSIMLYVPTIVEQFSLVIDSDTLKIEKSTATATISGSGVFVSLNGHILTCAHLFTVGPSAGVPTAVEYNGDIVPFELLYKDDDRDLALIKIEGNGYPYVRIADPRKLEAGQELIAIGNPLGLEFSVTHGIISALDRDFSFRYDANQSDTFINPGNSGGPLFNLDGELVGINSFIIPPVNANIFTGLGFSVSTNQIVEFLTKFRGVDKALPKLGNSYWEGFKRALGFDSGN